MDSKYLIFPNSHLQYPYQLKTKALQKKKKKIIPGTYSKCHLCLIHLCINFIGDVKPSCSLFYFLVCEYCGKICNKLGLFYNLLEVHLYLNC